MSTNLVFNGYELPKIPRKNILGVNTSLARLADLHGFIQQIILGDRKEVVLNVNVHALNLAYKTDWLKNIFNQSSLVFCDGAGVMLGAKLLGYEIPERITYADWMWNLAQFAQDNEFSLFFLGARPGVAQQAADRLLEQYPRLKIVGIQDGYFDKSFGCPDNGAVVTLINRVTPDILLVGFGMPIQERWLMENWDELDVRIGLTGGAVFDYISGNLKRAPRWMTDHGLEWLGRLIIEPKRLWKRYVLGNPLFLWRVFKQKIGWDKYDE